MRVEKRTVFANQKTSRGLDGGAPSSTPSPSAGGPHTARNQQAEPDPQTELPGTSRTQTTSERSKVGGTPGVSEENLESVSSRSPSASGCPVGSSAGGRSFESPRAVRDTWVISLPRDKGTKAQRSLFAFQTHRKERRQGWAQSLTPATTVPHSQTSPVRVHVHGHACARRSVRVHAHTSQPCEFTSRTRTRMFLG